MDLVTHHFPGLALRADPRRAHEHLDVPLEQVVALRRHMAGGGERIGPDRERGRDPALVSRRVALDDEKGRLGEVVAERPRDVVGGKPRGGVLVKLRQLTLKFLVPLIAEVRNTCPPITAAATARPTAARPSRRARLAARSAW